MDDSVLTKNIVDVIDLNLNTLNLNIPDVYDLTGIEDFTALEEFDCGFNNFSSLDLSSNISLIELWADQNIISNVLFPNTSTLYKVILQGNELSAINFENNNNFTQLYLFDNSFSSIDVSQHTNLEILELNENPLESIDLSNNLNLIALDLRYTELTELDVSVNTNLTNLDVRGNPNLSCVQVWDVDYANSMPFFSKDDDAIWSLDCGYETSMQEVLKNKNLITTIDILGRETNSKGFNIEIYDDGSVEKRYIN